MPSIKTTLRLLAIVSAYGLAAYWDAAEEQERQGDSLVRVAPDESPSHDNTSTTQGVQHAHR